MKIGNKPALATKYPIWLRVSTFNLVLQIWSTKYSLLYLCTNPYLKQQAKFEFIHPCKRTNYVSNHRIWNRVQSHISNILLCTVFQLQVLETILFIYCMGWTLSNYVSIHKIWNRVQCHIYYISLCTVFQLQVFRSNTFYLMYGRKLKKLF